MTGSVHAALGAALGHHVRNKPLAFLVGLLSHLIGDVVPHKDLGPGETPLVFGTLAWVGWRYGVSSPEFLGALGGVTPDFEHIPYELRKDPRRHKPMEEKWFPTHNAQVPHGEWPLHFGWGVAMQVVLYLGGLYFAGMLARPDRSKA